VGDDGLGEEQAEGYFASVSDLMVGVLFVFLLMLTVFALNYRDDSAQLADLIARAEQAERVAAQAERAAAAAQIEAQQQAKEARQRTQEANRLRAQNETLRLRLAEAATAMERELQDREQMRAVLLQRLAHGLDVAGIRFVLDQQSGVLHLSDEVPFATGRSDLTDPRTKHTVQVLAEVLASILPCFTQGAERHDCGSGDLPILEAVLVEGHTDKQSYPNLTAAQSQQENDRLSTARALTVFAELRQQKPVLDDLRNTANQPLLGVSGYGERRPLSDATTLAEADLKRNRRIDLRFVLSSRTSDELKRLLDEIIALQRADAP
jgi:chemotaxis protein MotB